MLRRRAGPALGLVPAEACRDHVSAVDLRGLGLDPLEAIRRAGEARFIIDMPLAACRGHKLAAFPCVPGSGHPFIETALLLLERPDTPYADTPLRAFHLRHQPATAAERLGLVSAHPGLARPASLAAYPWREQYETGDAKAERMLEAENRRHGSAIGAGAGFAHFGPVSPERGAFEVARLRALIDSVRADGFRIGTGGDGLCTAFLLVDGDTARASVFNGEHRVAALAALGHESAPLWPSVVVRREAAAGWPGVRDGVFTLAEALAVFDRIFAGRQPWDPPAPTRPSDPGLSRDGARSPDPAPDRDPN